MTVTDIQTSGLYYEGAVHSLEAQRVIALAECRHDRQALLRTKIERVFSSDLVLMRGGYNGCATNHSTESCLQPFKWIVSMLRSSATLQVSAISCRSSHADANPDMVPYEIRLVLPCDESLWAATSAEEVHRLDANLKMYGVRPINFLDSLKKCLHAHDVQTHAPARVLLMAGLLSVGLHVSRREKYVPSCLRRTMTGS